MNYLVKVYLFFDAVFIVLGILYWVYFLRSKKAYYFYISIGALMMMLFTPIVMVIPENRLNFWSLFFLLPGLAMLFTGMIWWRVKNPNVFFHFTKLSELPHNEEEPFRKDLFLYGIIFYLSGITGVIIYKQIDLLTASAAVIGTVILFVAPLKPSYHYSEKNIKTVHKKVS